MTTPLRGMATSWLAEVKSDTSEERLKDIFDKAGAFMVPGSRLPTDGKDAVTYEIQGRGNLDEYSFPEEVIKLYPNSKPSPL